MVFKPKLPPPDQIGNFFSAAIQRLLGVSPDGRTVFFTRGNGEVEKVDRKQTRIAFGSDGSSPALSPDGTHLALVGRDLKLRVIEADGKVFRNLGECELPAWSEDGNSLACISKDPSLLTIDVTNAVISARIALPPPDDHWVFATSIAWNPDDRSLLVVSLGRDSNSTSPYEDYWLVDLTSRNWKYVAAGNDAIWAADGSAIVYSSPRDLAPLPDGKHQEWVTRLKFLEINTLRLHVLVAGLSYNQDAQWCP